MGKCLIVVFFNKCPFDFEIKEVLTHSIIISYISQMNSKIVLAVFVLLMTSASAMSLRSHEGQYAWYTFDEGPTGNKCTNPDQCDGQRTCSPHGWCQGTSRPPKNADYNYDETPTGNKCPTSSSEANYANRDYYCDGNRTCSPHGWCRGTSR